MNARNTGGPAFPVNRPVAPEGTPFAASQVTSDGLTVRDYFAAMAMQGLLAADAANGIPDSKFFVAIADVSYQMADAMLEARA